LFIPRPEVLFRAVRALESAGFDGMRVGDFSRKFWRPPHNPGQNRIAGRFLLYMVDQGLAIRVGGNGQRVGDRALYQITKEGREYLVTFWQRATRRNVDPFVPGGSPAAAPAPTPEPPGYGDGW
jgi:hypothetical protein